jgi:hypothetical protein
LVILGNFHKLCVVGHIELKGCEFLGDATISRGHHYFIHPGAMLANFGQGVLTAAASDNQYL